MPYFHITELFEDPKGLNRKGVCVLIDSTKIKIMKSADQVFQNRTHYYKKGGHFLTFTNVTLTNGKVVLFTCGAASSSPTQGDGVITAKLIKDDLERAKRGEPLRLGLTRLIAGNDNYFTIGMNEMQKSLFWPLKVLLLINVWYNF